MSFFPLPEARSSQVKVLEEIEKAYSSGYKFVILEGPVGSGKSAIAISVARYFGNSHLITPKKSLQNQYYGDFSEHIVLMRVGMLTPVRRILHLINIMRL
jgi:ATP-dependent DNA helicase DinG